MNLEDCYFLGTITKKHGYKGDLVLLLDTDEPEYYQNLESIFIEKDGYLVPFFLSKARLVKGNRMIITPEDETEVSSFIGREVYLPLDTLPPLSGNKFYYHEIIGFDLFDKENKIGVIKRVLDNTAQDLMEIVTADDKKILIPLIDEWIIKLDRPAQRLTLKLPEGLIDLF